MRPVKKESRACGFCGAKFFIYRSSTNSGRFCSKLCYTNARLRGDYLGTRIMSDGWKQKISIGRRNWFKNHPRGNVKSIILHNFVVRQVAKALGGSLGAHVLFVDGAKMWRPDIIFIKNGYVCFWDVKTTENGKNVRCVMRRWKI